MASRKNNNRSQEFTSYPEQYHGYVRTLKGVDIFIRPLLSSDLELFRVFINSLSARTVYYRFLSPIREISEELFARLIQVDHKNDIALAAFKNINSQQIMLGVSRLYIEKNPSTAEVSVVVVDKWQGQGIGAELFNRCLEIGKSLGVKKIWGLILPENTQMLKLARKLNFTVKREKGSSEYFVSIDYDKKNSG